MDNSASRDGWGGVRGSSITITIVFVVLKLTHVIDWSWLWVLSPLWIFVALALVFGLVVFVRTLIAGIASGR